MRLKEFDMYEIYLKWAENTNNFRPFFRATNFVSLKHYPDFELCETFAAEDDTIQRIKKIANTFEGRNTIFMIDLKGNAGIRAAYFLQRDLKLQPILTFNQPLHEFGLVGDSEYISNLISCGRLLGKIEPEGYAFILDSNRYSEFNDEDYKRCFNNQYELTDEDLPCYEMLRDLRYCRLVYIFDQAMKEDSASYIEYLAEKGMEVVKEDLGGISYDG